jgi:hypothetical protein
MKTWIGAVYPADAVHVQRLGPRCNPFPLLQAQNSIPFEEMLEADPQLFHILSNKFVVVPEYVQALLTIAEVA